MEGGQIIFLILLLMLLVHIIEDFHLQGIMASMKQRSWWQANAPAPEYRHDFAVVLVLHGVEWSLLVAMPCILCMELPVPTGFLMLVLVQGLVHACIDHAKANMRTINLIQDQTAHIIQIIVTWLVWVMIS